MIKLTIIIPLLANRQAELVALEGIKKQGKNVELILEKSNENPSVNRNRGVKKAKTEYVAFVNAHTVLSDEWFEKVQDFISKYPEIDIFGGPQLNSDKDNFFGKISGHALSSIFGAASMAKRYKIDKLDLDADEFKLTSANLICKKEVFDKVKFDEGIYPGEDPKFITDAKNAGLKIAYTPDVVVFNKRRDSLSGLMKQIFTYGKMRPKKDSFFDLLKHPVFFFPSLFFLYLIFCLIILFTGFSVSFFIFVPFFAYLFLAIIFSLIESVKNKDFFAFFLLPFVFLAIHLSYGAGFLLGLFKSK